MQHNVPSLLVGIGYIFSVILCGLLFHNSTPGNEFFAFCLFPLVVLFL